MANLGSMILMAGLALIANQIVNASPMPVEITDGSWKKMADTNEIVTYSKDIEGTDVVAFRGEAIINASIAKVANVLIDTSRKLEWVHRAIEAKDIKQISELERIEYNRTTAGVPLGLVDDRDFLFRAWAEIDATKKKVTFRMKSIADPSVPVKKDAVRGELYNSAYFLSSVEGDAKTKLVVEIQADPKGSIPKWVVNLFQKAWPRNTIEGIQRQAEKADVQEHQGIKKALFKI